MKNEIELIHRPTRVVLFLKRFLVKGEKGATAVEYAILIGVIAVGIVAAGITLRDQIGTTLAKANCAVQGKTWSSTATTADKCI